MKLFFVILSVLTGFFLGILYGSLTLEDGSGLAGGAIVLMSGIAGAGFALIASLFTMNRINKKLLSKILWILVVLNLIPLSWVAYRIITKTTKREQLPPQKTKPHTSTTDILAYNFENKETVNDTEMGLGMAAPDFYDQKVFYFYNGPNLQKSIPDHTATDSIVFRESDHHHFEITYAPPWFYPASLKLDYEILYLKIIAMNRDWVQVEVNKKTGLSSWINPSSARLMMWPEFLLTVHSVELKNPADNPVRARPFLHSDPVLKQEHSFLKPVLIKDQWMQVELLQDNFEKTGGGWIRWQDGKSLLVSYNLLS